MMGIILKKIKRMRWFRNYY